MKVNFAVLFLISVVFDVVFTIPCAPASQKSLTLHQIEPEYVHHCENEESRIIQEELQAVKQTKENSSIETNSRSRTTSHSAQGGFWFHSNFSNYFSFFCLFEFQGCHNCWITFQYSKAEPAGKAELIGIDWKLIFLRTPTSLTLAHRSKKHPG